MIHIVDDDPGLIQVLAELAELFCFRTRCFTDPADYLAYAESDRFTLPEAVFCDVMMQGMNGFELMQQVQALHPGSRFVMISGIGHPVPAALRSACAYLLKPIGFERLEKTFRHLRTCRECGPTHALVKAWPDDRERFDTIRFTCPFSTDKDR